MHPVLRDAAPALSRLDLDPTPTPVQRAGLAARLADAADRWRPILRHDPDRRWYARLLRTEGGSRTWFGPDHAHVLGNRGPGPATSVHAYSPPGLPLRFAPRTVGAAR
jgi:hypothetical protein